MGPWSPSQSSLLLRFSSIFSSLLLSRINNTPNSNSNSTWRQRSIGASPCLSWLIWFYWLFCLLSSIQKLYFRYKVSFNIDTSQDSNESTLNTTYTCDIPVEVASSGLTRGLQPSSLVQRWVTGDDASGLLPLPWAASTLPSLSTDVTVSCCFFFSGPTISVCVSEPCFFLNKKHIHSESNTMCIVNLNMRGRWLKFS